MKWLLAGASGFLGNALRVRLASEGHEVVRLVRREPAARSEFRWDPYAGEVDPAAFAGVDAVLNLAGVNLYTRPWTTSRREKIVASRAQTTGTLARALAERVAKHDERPVFLAQSATGYYGVVSGQRPHTEESPAGPDFAAQVCVQWEAPARIAADAGVRVVVLRAAPVLDRSGGSLQLMRLAWSCGLGAKLGNGAQRMPMISLEDYLRAVLWLAGNSAASGPYNLTIPEPTTNAEFTDALARALRRPRVLAAPEVALRTALGELADIFLGDTYVVPERLTEAGFTYGAPDVNSTIAVALHRG
jgi:uncharacterized protein (TIGR01777 family)